jgi:hypothetical protein
MKKNFKLMVQKFKWNLTLLLLISMGSLQAQNLFLNFDGQPNFTNSWSENGYTWNIVQGNSGYISPGTSISGNNKLQIAQETTIMEACGSFNTQSLYLRA